MVCGVDSVFPLGLWVKPCGQEGDYLYVEHKRAVLSTEVRKHFLSENACTLLFFHIFVY